jgi:hypothetical protein
MPVTLGGPTDTCAQIDDGVIEEARARERRRWAASGAFVALAVLVLVYLLAHGGGSRNNPAGFGKSGSGRPLKLALVQGRVYVGGVPALMGVTWSLQAGNVGVCVRIVSRGDCNGQPPTRAYPVYGGPDGFSPEETVGPQGEIDALFTAPGVAGVRVAHLGTFPAHTAPGLPPGAKQIVFYRPPGSRGTVLPPGVSPSVLQGFEHAKAGPALSETLLDTHGHAIGVGKSSVFTLPNRYWTGPNAPTSGRCSMRSSMPSTRVAWGQVASVIAADQSITTAAWLTCLHIWFTQDGTSYEAALLLNAHAPGAAPAALWGARPLQGHPGIYEITPIQREIRIPPLGAAQARHELAVDTKLGGRSKAEAILRESSRRVFVDTFVPPGVARRVGPAWLLVNYGPNLAKRIAFLESLRVTKLQLGTR